MNQFNLGDVDFMELYDDNGKLFKICNKEKKIVNIWQYVLVFLLAISTVNIIDNFDSTLNWLSLAFIIWCLFNTERTKKKIEKRLEQIEINQFNLDFVRSWENI